MPAAGGGGGGAGGGGDGGGVTGGGGGGGGVTGGGGEGGGVTGGGGDGGGTTTTGGGGGLLDAGGAEPPELPPQPDTAKANTKDVVPTTMRLRRCIGLRPWPVFISIPLPQPSAWTGIESYLI